MRSRCGLQTTTSTRRTSWPDDLTHRLHRFRVRLVAGQEPVVEEHAAFGAPRGPGALRVVESIEVDPEAGRLFVADESRKSYLEYDTNGEYQGRALAEGRVEGDPEGIVLVRCTVGGGYWVVTDQQDGRIALSGLRSRVTRVRRHLPRRSHSQHGWGHLRARTRARFRGRCVVCRTRRQGPVGLRLGRRYPCNGASRRVWARVRLTRSCHLVISRVRLRGRVTIEEASRLTSGSTYRVRRP